MAPDLRPSTVTVHRVRRQIDSPLLLPPQPAIPHAIHDTTDASEVVLNGHKSLGSAEHIFV